MAEQIKSAVEDFIRKLQAEQGPVSVIQNHWKEIAGDVLSKHSRPVKIYRKNLVVQTDSTNEGYLLRMQQREILKKIKAVCFLELTSIIANVRQ